jgi:phosphatidylinositol alpha-1,6-mannosyltransferase
LRFLVVSREFPPVVGGIGTLTRNLIEGLVRRGANGCVLTTASGAASRVPNGFSTVTVAAGARSKIQEAMALWFQICFLWRRDKPEYVLLMAWTVEGIACRLASLFFPIHYVVFVHGTDILRNSSRWRTRFLMKWVIDRADLVVANSRFTAAAISDVSAWREKVSVIHPAVSVGESTALELSEIEAQLNLAGRLVLFTAARLIRRKGQDRVISILPRLVHRFPGVVYVMTGNGPYKGELIERARQCGVSDRVKFLGDVSAKELDALHRRADVFVSPGFFDGGDVEGFGIAFVEAGARGTPVVAGRCGGIPEAVLDGVTGVLIDSANDNELYEALSRLLSDGELREKLGAAGRKRAEELAPARVAEDLLKELVGVKKRSRVLGS